MLDRYRDRIVGVNDSETYNKFIEDRNLKLLRQFLTPYFVYPTPDELKKVDIREHIWKTGDRFYKLANTYYGDSRDWWVIAKFNHKPTESHVMIGDILYIPVPASRILNYMTG